MSVLQWLLEKPRRDYFNGVEESFTSTRDTYKNATAKPQRREVTILNMRVGDYVTYRSVDYYVRQRYLYKAGAYEWIAYQFSDSSRQNDLWLDVEDDDRINIHITESIKIPPGLSVEHLKAQKPFKLKGELFNYDEHGHAQVKIEKENNRWDSAIVEYWDYFNDDESKFISFEKWGDELEASTGHPIKDYELEIYPGS